MMEIFAFILIMWKVNMVKLSILQEKEMYICTYS